MCCVWARGSLFGWGAIDDSSWLGGDGGAGLGDGFPWVDNTVGVMWVCLYGWGGKVGAFVPWCGTPAEGCLGGKIGHVLVLGQGTVRFHGLVVSGLLNLDNNSQNPKVFEAINALRIAKISKS